MESIELSEITVIPQDKVLYSEILCDKVNSKLKKLHVQIKQTAATDGSKVFTLDIRGIRHKFRLQIDFSPQDVCFLRFDEFKENVREPSCFPCLNRNYYPNIVFSRLMFLLYSDPGDGGEAKCIKIPLLQRGNIMAASALRKLQYVLHSYVASQDELKHWLVQIVSCIGFDAGEYVFLGVTRHALVVVQDFIIRQYHTFYGNTFTVSSDPDSKQLDIIVVNKRDPARFNQYIFQTVHWSSIESMIQSMQTTDLPRPRAHFNILHSEVSASGFIPGTTSDNVTILPHYHFENNNSSSGSNGYLHPPPQRLPSEKISNTVMVHNGPEPHITPHHSSSTSNGHIPSNDSGPTVVSNDSNVQLRRTESSRHDDNADDSEIHVRHSDIFRLSNKPLIPELTPPTPHKLEGSPGQNTDPCQTQKDLAVPPPRSPSCDNFEGEFDNMAFEPGPGDVSAGLVFVDNDLLNIPPPQPCSALPHPHGEFFPQKPPVPCTDEPESSGSTFLSLPKRQQLPRSISCSLSDMELTDHWYVNVEQTVQWRNSVYEDSPYVRFYYNVGFVRFARMSKKLKRRERLSKELAKVDFNKLENHEKWFDTCFKLRDKDMRFCRLSRTSMNIKSEEDLEIYSEPTPETPVPDHPYWNSSLCLTIQRMLQEGPGGSQVSGEIQRVFDLTHEQLVSVQVLLSLVPSERNWRDLAEHIGLGSGDVSIIEHFCYTYRELAARVVLYHWLTMCQEAQHEIMTDSSFDSLKAFVDDIERGDIRNVLVSHNANKHRQSQEDLTFSNEAFNRHIQRPQDLSLPTKHNMQGQKLNISRLPDNNDNRHAKSHQDLRLPSHDDNRHVKSHLDLSLRSRDDNIDPSLHSLEDNRHVPSRPGPRMNNLNSYRLQQSQEDLRSQTLVKPVVIVEAAGNTRRKEVVEHEDTVVDEEEEEFNTRL